MTVQPSLTICFMVFKLIWGWCYCVARDRSVPGSSNLQLTEHCDVVVIVEGLSRFQEIQFFHITLKKKKKSTSLYLLRAASQTFSLVDNSHHHSMDYYFDSGNDAIQGTVIFRPDVLAYGIISVPL